MIVAMISVRMVQMSRNQIVSMVAMRNCFMTTVNGVFVGSNMFTRTMARSANGRIHIADSQNMLIHVRGMRMM